MHGFHEQAVSSVVRVASTTLVVNSSCFYNCSVCVCVCERQQSHAFLTGWQRMQLGDFTGVLLIQLSRRRSWFWCCWKFHRCADSVVAVLIIIPVPVSVSSLAFRGVMILCVLLLVIPDSRDSCMLFWWFWWWLWCYSVLNFNSKFEYIFTEMNLKYFLLVTKFTDLTVTPFSSFKNHHSIIIITFQ